MKQSCAYKETYLSNKVNDKLSHTNQSWMANLYKQCKNENSRNIYTLLNHTVLDLFYTLKDTEPKVATYKVRQTPLLPIHHESPFNFFWPYIKVFALAIQLNFNNFKLIHSSVCILPQDALHSSISLTLIHTTINMSVKWIYPLRITYMHSCLRR